MRVLAGVLAVLILIGNSMSMSYADERGTRDEAVALVAKVRASFQKDGPDATLKAISDPANPTFRNKDLYPFVFNREGVQVAHGANQGLIGKNLTGVKDQNGKFMVQEVLATGVGPGKGWVDYSWPDPISKKIVEKSSYVEIIGDYIVGVGIYR
jgi:cytochrome c